MKSKNALQAKSQSIITIIKLYKLPLQRFLRFYLGDFITSASSILEDKIAKDTVKVISRMHPVGRTDRSIVLEIILKNTSVIKPILHVQ